MEGKAEEFFSHLAGASFIHHCLIVIVWVVFHASYQKSEHWYK